MAGQPPRQAEYCERSFASDGPSSGRGSHRTLSRSGWPDYVFAFHEDEELGPRMLARMAKHTGLRPGDL
jgi:hypothetical protein